MTINPNTDFNSAIDKTRDASKKTFRREIETTLNTNFQIEKINIFFLDKNFTTETIESLYNDLKTICGEKYNFKIITLIPNTLYPINEEGISFPFSWSYFIQAYFRLKNRKDHETLSYMINQYAHYILLSFLFLFKETQFNINNNKINFCKISFVDERKIELPQEMITLFKKIFKKTRSNIFNIHLMNNSDDLIEEFFTKIEEMFDPSSFDDTREKIYKELVDIIEKNILTINN
jgi:hypothetical protein